MADKRRQEAHRTKAMLETAEQQAQVVQRLEAVEAQLTELVEINRRILLLLTTPRPKQNQSPVTSTESA